MFIWQIWIEIQYVEYKREVCWVLQNTKPNRPGSPKFFHLKPLFQMFVHENCLNLCKLILFKVLRRLLGTQMHAHMQGQMKDHDLDRKNSYFCEILKYFVKSKMSYIFLSEVHPELKGRWFFKYCMITTFVMPNFFFLISWRNVWTVLTMWTKLL